MGEPVRTTIFIDALSEQAQGLLAARRSAEAVPLLKELIARLDAERPGEVQTRGEARRLLGTALRDTGDLAGSTAALEDSIRLLRPAAWSTDQKRGLAIALRSVAMNYDAAGHADSAATARQESLEIAGALLAIIPDDAPRIFFAIGDDLKEGRHSDWHAPLDALSQKVPALPPAPAIHVLYALGKYWRQSGRPDLAKDASAKALARVGQLGSSALSAEFPIVHNLAHALLSADDVGSARELTDRLASVADATQLDRVYAVRRLQALVARAEPGQSAVDAARSVYDFARESFGEDEERTRISEGELAGALAAADQPREAIKTYRDVLDREQRVGKNPLTTASMAFALGQVLDEESRFEEAIEAHWTAFQLRDQALGGRHPVTNKSRHEVAELSRVLGRVEEAEYLFREALDVEEEQHGPGTEFAALMRNNLGDVYSSVGRDALAHACFDTALAARVALFGPDSEGAWRSRLSLAALANRTGRSEETATLARAGAAREKSSVLWHLILGTALVRKGYLDEAEGLFERMHEGIPRDLIGSGVAYEVWSDIVEGLTTCRMARGDWRAAVDVASSVTPIVRDRLPSIVQGSSELQLTKFARHTFDVQSLWLWSLSQLQVPTAEQRTTAFEFVQLTKGLRTRYLRWRQPGVGNVDQVLLPEDQKAQQQPIVEFRKRQAELTDALLSGDHDDGQPEPMSVLFTRLRLRQLERQLAGRISDSELVLDDLFTGVKALPAGTVGIELLVVRDLINERRVDGVPAHHYMAFVTGASQPPRLVDLGLCDDIDYAITAMRDSLVNEPWTDQARPPAWRGRARFLGNTILAPMWDEIGAGSHLLIAPDGLLGAVPFEILLTPDGEYLLDKIKVSYLMRLGEAGRDAEPYRKGAAPVVIAGPDFDLARSFVGHQISPYGPERLLARALGGAARFQSLAKTHDEGQVVAKLLEVEPLIGVWALAPELVRGRSPEIVHIATHGFSLPYENAEMRASLAAPLGNDLDRRAVLGDPMQRSGLAMSGANARLDKREIPPEAGTGIIFAADIQQLDLQRTDLVVLSACRSGLGDIAVGDGAHGLRRAFLAAGARSVLSALWDVPDESSMTLVTEFFQQLLNKVPRVEALAAARAVVREAHPRDPIHWAGFVLDGNFGPLGRFSPLSDLKIANVSYRISSKDPEGMARIAKQIVSGPELDESFLTSVITLKQVVGRPDLAEDTRVFALKRLADLANRLGDNDAAIRWYREVLQNKAAEPGERVAVSYNIAKILHTSGDVAAGVKAYTELLTQQQPGAEIRSHALANRGYAYMQLERFEDAVADFTAVLKDKEAPPDQHFMARMNRAVALSGMGDAKSALDDIDVVLKSDQATDIDKLKFRIFRAELLIDLNQRKTALGEIEDLEKVPNLSEESRARLEGLRAAAT